MLNAVLKNANIYTEHGFEYGTLVIENGSLDNWDAENRIYTSGNNSIQIFGDAKVSLVFEADSSLPEGVFSPAASEKIFEDKNKGMLA